MIKEFDLENCGPLGKIRWRVSPKINLVIGENGTGKSFLLKIIYAVLRSTEQYQRGDESSRFAQILGDKLRGTFQLEQIGDLVKKGTDRLRFECELEEQKISFSFSPRAVRGVGEISKIVKPRSDSLSLFLPPKEILSLTPIIKKSRLQDQIFGFDDTYLDLAIALEGEPSKGRTSDNLAEARKRLLELCKGKLEQSGESWVFREGHAKHPIHITAEGIKRLALIDRIIGNRSLTPGSVLFIDEPEATLHPKAVVTFMEILFLLATQDIQIFMASHSYFVLKSLYIIAKRECSHIQMLSLIGGSEYTITDLSEEMPDNPIIDESIKMYEREIDVELQAES
jgi:energy-coupling factor transporter ATP-binding protein EcfA2